MDPDLFIQFSNGNPLSCSTQTLIEPVSTLAAELTTKLETPAPEPGTPLTRMQQSDPEKRARCIAALTVLPETLITLNDYIAESLETIIDDLCLMRSVRQLDQLVGVTTGDVSRILTGEFTGRVSAIQDQMTAFDRTIADYMDETIGKTDFETALDALSDQLESLAQDITTGIRAETEEKARIVKQHKAMSTTMRVQILRENEDTQALLSSLGLS